MSTYELLKYYYHKRFNALVGVMREKMKMNPVEITYEDMTPVYKEVCKDWIEKPYCINESPAQIGTIEAVGSLLSKCSGYDITE